MAIKNYGATDKSKSWLVGGTLYAYDLDSNDAQQGKARSLGFCEGIDLSFETSEIALYSSNFGPRAKVRENIIEQNVNIQIILRDVSPENAALALFGTSTSNTAAVGVVETHTAYLGGIVALDGIIDAEGTAPTVTSDDGGTDYTEGTDYEVNQGSIYILETGTITDAEVIKVTYDQIATETVEGILDAVKQVGLYFEGENISENGEIVKVDIYKVSLSPTDNYSIMSSEDFVTLTLNGAVLESKAAKGTSKYYREIRQA